MGSSRTSGSGSRDLQTKSFRGKGIPRTRDDWRANNKQWEVQCSAVMLLLSRQNMRNLEVESSGTRILMKNGVSNGVFEKLKVENHIYRDHVRPDEVPFYCRRCTFHCQRQDQMMNHVRSYGPHVDQVRRRCIQDKGRAFRVESKSPYVIGACDYLRLEAEESIKHWMKVPRGNQGSKTGIGVGTSPHLRTPPTRLMGHASTSFSAPGLHGNMLPVAGSYVQPSLSQPQSLQGATTQMTSAQIPPSLSQPMITQTTLLTSQDLGTLACLLKLPAGRQGLVQTQGAPTQYLTEPVNPAFLSITDRTDACMTLAGEITWEQRQTTSQHPVIPSQTIGQTPASAPVDGTIAQTHMSSSIFGFDPIGYQAQAGTAQNL